LNQDSAFQQTREETEFIIASKDAMEIILPNSSVQTSFSQDQWQSPGIRKFPKNDWLEGGLDDTMPAFRSSAFLRWLQHLSSAHVGALPEMKLDVLPFEIG
jgi:hypothetical protein